MPAAAAMLRPALLTAAAALACALCGCDADDGGSASEVTVAERGVFTATTTSDGEVKAMTELSVASPTWGRIEWLAVAGAEVKKGDVIARLESRDQVKRSRDLARDLETVKREVQELDANLSIERRRTALDIERSEAELQVVQVRLKELEEMPTPEKLAEAEAEYTSAKASAESAVRTSADQADLAVKGFATDAEAETARIDAELATARAALSEIALRKVKAGPDPYELRRAQNTVQRCRINLDIAKQNASAAIKALDASIDSARERLRMQEKWLKDNSEDIAQRKVRAPRDGIVVPIVDMRRGKIEEGSRVWKGMAMMTLPDLAVMKVRSCVSESDIRYLKVSDVVEVTVDPVPGVVYKAKVFWIDNWARDKNDELSDADMKKQGLSGLRVFNFEAEMIEKDPRLKLGFKARVTVTLERLDDAVSVDARAIRREGGSQYVYAFDGARAARRAVELGPACSGRVVVTKGLAGGEKVLLR